MKLTTKVLLKASNGDLEWNCAAVIPSDQIALDRL